MTDDNLCFDRRGTHIVFKSAPKVKPNAKTLRWWVQSIYEPRPVLADIAWFGRWRKYAMYPRPGTVFEEVCLREIAAFCEERTKEHRANRKAVRTPDSNPFHDEESCGYVDPTELE
jgi:hypothetical protein